MAYGGLGMNTAREIFGEIGALVSLPVSDVHTPDNRPTLPFARRIRFGGAAAVQIYKSAGFPRGALTTLIKPRLGMH